jgi:hypothetical protein
MDLHRFAEQFTNSRAEFEFINVGPGKENADSKMNSKTLLPIFVLYS